MRGDMRTARRWFGQYAVKAARGAMENGKKRRGGAHGTAARARDDMRLGLRDAVEAGVRGAMENGKKRCGRAHGRRLRRGMKRDWVCATPSKLGRAYGR